MMTRSPRASQRVRVTTRLQFALVGILAVVGLASGCTPEQVHQAAAHLGVSLTEGQAQAVADHHNRPQATLVSVRTDSIDPASITPEQARAIAWTALVVQQQQAAAALPCRNGKCTTAAQWAALRKCESGGNYRAVNPTGKYRGAYQMDHDFWSTYGDGSAPTADRATPASQDAAAYAGFRARGWQPWTCRSAVPGR